MPACCAHVPARARDVNHKKLTIAAAVHQLVPLFDLPASRDDFVNAFRCCKAASAGVVLTAAQVGDVLILKELLAAGFDVNAALRNGDTAASIAARRGDEEMLEALIAAGAAVTAPVWAAGTQVCVLIDVVRSSRALRADGWASHRSECFTYSCCAPNALCRPSNTRCFVAISCLHCSQQ